MPPTLPAAHFLRSKLGQFLHISHLDPFVCTASIRWPGIPCILLIVVEWNVSQSFRSYENTENNCRYVIQRQKTHVWIATLPLPLTKALVFPFFKYISVVFLFAHVFLCLSELKQTERWLGGDTMTSKRDKSLCRWDGKRNSAFSNCCLASPSVKIFMWEEERVNIHWSFIKKSKKALFTSET